MWLRRQAAFQLTSHGSHHLLKFIRVWQVILGCRPFYFFQPLPSLPKASFNTRPSTSGADFSGTHQVDLRGEEGRQRARFDIAFSLKTQQMSRDSCCQLRFGRKVSQVITTPEINEGKNAGFFSYVNINPDKPYGWLQLHPKGNCRRIKLDNPTAHKKSGHLEYRLLRAYGLKGNQN